MATHQQSRKTYMKTPYILQVTLKCREYWKSLTVSPRNSCRTSQTRRLESQLCINSIPHAPHLALLSHLGPHPLPLLRPHPLPTLSPHTLLPLSLHTLPPLRPHTSPHSAHIPSPHSDHIPSAHSIQLPSTSSLDIPTLANNPLPSHSTV